MFGIDFFENLPGLQPGVTDKCHHHYLREKTPTSQKTRRTDIELFEHLPG
jgi:hypothetical protein